MIGPEHERRRPAPADGFADAVTFSWGDADADVFGLARVGLVAGAEPAASVLVVVFAGGEPVAVRAQGVSVPQDADFAALEAGGLRTEILEPLTAWRAVFDGDGARLNLRFDAAGPPLELAADSAAVLGGGMEGYEQLCRVSGSVEAAGGRRELECLGQRGHTWGSVDWARMESARSVSAWWGEDAALTLTAVRPEGAQGQDEDAVTAYLADAGQPAVPLDEARLSTTFDADGRQRRAGLELWETAETEIPRRATGELVCGTSLDLGELRMECAFFRWSLDGREGAGRYDVVRRA